MRTEDTDHVCENNYIFDIDCLQTMRGLGGREVPTPMYSLRLETIPISFFVYLYSASKLLGAAL